MTTASDIILGALRRLTSYAPGDQLAAVDANDALSTLNDLLDSWSTQNYAVFGSAESILYYTGGVTQYTIGNPIGGTFIGTLASGSSVISGVTPLPANLAVGGDLTCLSNLAQGTVSAIGVNSVTMSAPATGARTADTFTFTVPGAFKTARPLRITAAFTRITTQGSGYDYPIEILTQDRYVAFGLKSIPYPWPTCLWYNPAYPYGILNFYGAPASGGELHLFTDTILSNLTLTQTVQMPQGYVRALKWALAREICLEYGFGLTPALEKLYRESFDAIRSINAEPTRESRLDTPRFGGGHADAGGILYGFYR